MRTLYDVPAPAKLNLFLHITGRRPDGYHLIESVFMLIDWQDRLHFDLRADGQITRQDLSGMRLPDNDLIVRAARALQAATGCTAGAHIGVDKSIPAQAGMGGGSSDAASTLLALNRLWGLNLPRPALEKIGLKLGADLPFFLRGKNAWVQGIGDIITPLDETLTLSAQRFMVLKPDSGLETKLIFSSPSLQRDSEHATIADFAAKLYDFGHNDLQPVAQTLCPDVKKAVDLLKMHGLQARMTGSGSAVFAPIEQTIEIKDAPSEWIVKVCNNLTAHPLHGWAKD